MLCHTGVRHPLLLLQAEHPLLWDEERLSWLNGSPMSKKLAQRTKQVSHDVQALVEAGANDIRWEPDVKEPLISDYSTRWAAATLLSRAFNLDIPIQSLNGESTLDAVKLLVRELPAEVHGSLADCWHAVHGHPLLTCILTMCR